MLAAISTTTLVEAILRADLARPLPREADATARADRRARRALLRSFESRLGRSVLTARSCTNSDRAIVDRQALTRQAIANGQARASQRL